MGINRKYKDRIFCMLFGYPNMPLRGILYSARLFSKYIKANKLNIYSEKLIKIPTPQYYVLYNGKRKIPS